MRLRAVVIALTIAVVALGAERLADQRDDLYDEVKQNAQHNCRHLDVRDTTHASVFHCSRCCDSDFEVHYYDFPSEARLEEALQALDPYWNGTDACLVGTKAVVGYDSAYKCRGWGGHLQRVSRR